MSTTQSLSAPRPAPAAKRRSLLVSTRKYLPIYLFLVPTFALLAVFTFYPIFSAFWHAFYRWDGVNSEFVGMRNFVEMFTIDQHVSGLAAQRRHADHLPHVGGADRAALRR